MEVGQRELDGATLQVCISQAVPEHMRDGIRELLSIQVPLEQRRQGLATKLLASVTEEADTAGKVLLITVRNFGADGMTCDQLRAWYGKFGFREIQAEPLMMARAPRVEQEITAPMIGSARLPPELEKAQTRIGELRKAGVPLQQALSTALSEVRGRETLRLAVNRALH